MSSKNITPAGNTSAATAINPANGTGSDDNYRLGRDNLITDANGNTYEVNTSSGTRMVHQTSSLAGGAGTGTGIGTVPSGGTNSSSSETRSGAGTGASSSGMGTSRGVGSSRAREKDTGRGADGYRRGRENLTTDAEGNIYEMNTSTGTRLVESATPSADMNPGKEKMVG